MHRRHIIRSSVVIALVALVLGSTVRIVRAGALTVTTTADSGPGSLRTLIAAANPGDIITFGLTGTIRLTSGEIVIDKNLSINGPGSGRLAISGNRSSRVFTVRAGANVTLSSLTITRGQPTGIGVGGGVSTTGAS